MADSMNPDDWTIDGKPLTPEERELLLEMTLADIKAVEGSAVCPVVGCLDEGGELVRWQVQTGVWHYAQLCASHRDGTLPSFSEWEVDRTEPIDARRFLVTLIRPVGAA